MNSLCSLLGIIFEGTSTACSNAIRKEFQTYLVIILEHDGIHVEHQQAISNEKSFERRLKVWVIIYEPVQWSSHTLIEFRLENRHCDEWK